MLSKYFNLIDPMLKDNFSLLETKIKSSKEVFDKEEMYLISGDFWGIQKFIFEGLTTDKAAKVLRAKSAFVLIYMEFLSKYICEKFGIDEKYIISLTAGKFEILSPKFDEKLFLEIEEEVNNYFLTNYFGMSGVSLIYKKVKKEEFFDNYKTFRMKVIKEVEKKKFQKFDLKSNNQILSYDTSITNKTLCPICNIRKKEEEYCKICNSFVELGKKLTNRNVFYLGNDEFDIFTDAQLEIKVTKQIKSYIPKNGNTPFTLEEIANFSGDEEKGIKALGVLKADVDGMGNFIKDSDVTDNFDNFEIFSKGLDGFFSLYVVDILRKKYRNIYTIFTGGDDLFLVGAWDEILSFSRDIREKFREFVKNKSTKHLTISFGIVVAKPSVPIKYLADVSEENLEEAKEFCCDSNYKKLKKSECKEDSYKKDAICMFDEVVNWNSYIEVFKKLDTIFKEIKKDNDFDTTYLYRILAICDMSKKLQEKFSLENSLWRSKLVYLARDDKDEQKLNEKIVSFIENKPIETKLFLVEYIYKRRKI